jgi:hypothetical protein
MGTVSTPLLLIQPETIAKALARCAAEARQTVKRDLIWGKRELVGVNETY